MRCVSVMPSASVRESSISTSGSTASSALGSSENPRMAIVGRDTARPVVESTATVICTNPPSPSTRRSDKVLSPMSPTDSPST